MRSQDWPLQLAATIEGARKRPFSFGEQDCLLFAADCVLAMTGQDFAARRRGTYHDERSALKVIACYGSMRAMATAMLGPEIDARLAHRGDVVLVLQGGRESLAVCAGARLWAPGADGLVSLAMTEARGAWRI